MTVVAARVSGQDEASGRLSLRLKQLARSLGARGVDLGGTRSLEARRVSKVADEGNARADTQRQEIILVAQERNRLGGDARSQLVVLLEVVGTAATICRAPARPGAGISRLPPARAASTALFEPPQSETTMPSKPHSVRRMSVRRCLFSCA